jgi:hypothetical protein
LFVELRLFGHRAGEREQPIRHAQPQSFRRLEVDHQFELGRLLDRKIRRARALTNALALAANRGLLQSGADDLADKRRRFAEETAAKPQDNHPVRGRLIKRRRG